MHLIYKNLAEQWSPTGAIKPVILPQLSDLATECAVFLAGMTVLLPFASTLQTDFFANERAGKPVECVGLAPGVKPPDACMEAHSDVVMWKSWAAFIQNVVLAVYFNPAVGTWSDLYGRQLFIVLALLLNMLPPLTILLYLKDITKLYWYGNLGHLSSGFMALGHISLLPEGRNNP